MPQCSHQLPTPELNPVFWTMDLLPRPGALASGTIPYANIGSESNSHTSVSVLSNNRPGLSSDARADRADDKFNHFVQSMENTVHLMLTQMQDSSRRTAEQASIVAVDAAQQAAETSRKDRAIMQRTLMSHRKSDALELDRKLGPMIRTMITEHHGVQEPSRITGDQAAFLTSLAEIRARAADDGRTSAAAIAELTASVRLL